MSFLRPDVLRGAPGSDQDGAKRSVEDPFELVKPRPVFKVGPQKVVDTGL